MDHPRRRIEFVVPTHFHGSHITIRSQQGRLEAQDQMLGHFYGDLIFDPHNEYVEIFCVLRIRKLNPEEEDKESREEARRLALDRRQTSDALLSIRRSEEALKLSLETHAWFDWIKSRIEAVGLKLDDLIYASPGPQNAPPKPFKLQTDSVQRPTPETVLMFNNCPECGHNLASGENHAQWCELGKEMGKGADDERS